ncbi:hypothetical protein FV219_10785, partial [Methylobacterium sp. WL122]
MAVDRAARRTAGAGALFIAAVGLPAPSLAAGADLPSWGFGSHMHNVAAAAIFGGLVAFATIVALLYLSERSRWTRRRCRCWRCGKRRRRWPTRRASARCR